jgi:hypothetical protein
MTMPKGKMHRFGLLVLAGVIFCCLGCQRQGPVTRENFGDTLKDICRRKLQ